jgi:hypothetical protein
MAASLLGDVFQHHDPRRKAAFLNTNLAALRYRATAISPSRVVLMDHQPGLPAWRVSIANGFIGGLAEWLIASGVRWQGGRKILGRFAGRQFPLVGALLGIAVGWQAIVTIFALSTIVTLILLTTLGGNSRPLRFAATAVLSTVAFLHQPAWKWLAGLWY